MGTDQRRVAAVAESAVALRTVAPPCVGEKNSINWSNLPYGVRIEYNFPGSKDAKETKLFIHLKDQRKIQAGKRWSQGKC